MNTNELEKIIDDVINWYNTEKPRINGFVDEIVNCESDTEKKTKTELLWNEIWRGL